MHRFCHVDWSLMKQLLIACLQEAAGKGLIAGSFRLIRGSQVVLNARSASEVSQVLKSSDRSNLTNSGHFDTPDTR